MITNYFRVGYGPSAEVFFFNDQPPSDTDAAYRHARAVAVLSGKPLVTCYPARVDGVEYLLDRVSKLS